MILQRVTNNRASSRTVPSLKQLVLQGAATNNLCYCKSHEDGPE